jgi:hypothetical protein
MTSAQRRQQATDLRDAALADSSALQAGLDTLGTQFPDLARLLSPSGRRGVPLLPAAARYTPAPNLQRAPVKGRGCGTP